MKKKSSIVAIIAILGAVAAWVCVHYAVSPAERNPAGSQAERAGGKPGAKQTRDRARDARPAKKSGGLSRLRRPGGTVAKKVAAEATPTASKAPADGNPGRLAPADEALATKVQDAMDADDRQSALSAALKAMASQEPEVRRQAVAALSWHGGPGVLPHLRKMLADPDAEVAESALNAVEDFVMGMDDAASQFKTATAYMTDYKENDDARMFFAGVATSSAGELVATPDTRQMVVDAILTMIEADGPLGEQAKELYSGVTGEEWISRSEALRWSKDPDGYEAPAAH